MYEQHFGLRKRPFLTKVTGTDVFVGPQSAQTLSSLEKALESRDAVVTVSGSAGSGKTTLVGQALDTLADTHRLIHLGRMQLKGTDVLEFLLQELGTPEPPRGPIRQFAVLREKLGELESDDLHVVIVVEDALRTGVETLAELEALTAADAGGPTGAAIVLMGDDRLTDFLKDPQLARLEQRVRQRHSIDPLSATELRSYLTHCFRLAGADFELFFDGRSAELIHQLCRGVPRIANNIVESAMSTAAADDIKQISAAYIASVAREKLGLEAAGFNTTKSETTAEPVPVIAPADETNDGPQTTDDAEIELVQDALPEPDARSHEPVPEWEREPTLAQLKPDLDALEKAMAFAQGDPAKESESAEENTAKTEAATADDTTDDIPEITLDDSIKSRIEDNLIDEPGQISAIDPEASADAEVDAEAPDVEAEAPEVKAETPEVKAETPEVKAETPEVKAEIPEVKAETPEAEAAPQTAGKTDGKTEEIAAELAKARTIEDVDDKLAETLFGEEVSLVASQAVANGQVAESANDGDLSLSDTAAQGGNSGLDLSASQRLETVRALNANSHPSLHKSGALPPTAAPPTEPPHQPETPEPIEDQIDTSMTETLKALSARPSTSDHTNSGLPDFDDEDEEDKNGFFSRFKRS